MLNYEKQTANRGKITVEAKLGFEICDYNTMVILSQGNLWDMVD